MAMEKNPRRRFLQISSLFALGGCARQANQPVEESLPSALGKPVRPYGEPSTYETSKRLVPDLKRPQIGSSSTPLAAIEGIITPSSLHFERHHSGVPEIDPAKHTLLLHGMVDRPLIFTLADLKRLPSESHIHFLECAGN